MQERQEQNPRKRGREKLTFFPLSLSAQLPSFFPPSPFHACLPVLRSSFSLSGHCGGMQTWKDTGRGRHEFGAAWSKEILEGKKTLRLGSPSTSELPVGGLVLRNSSSSGLPFPFPLSFTHPSLPRRWTCRGLWSDIRPSLRRSIHPIICSASAMLHLNRTARSLSFQVHLPFSPPPNQFFFFFFFLFTQTIHQFSHDFSISHL